MSEEQEKIVIIIEKMFKSWRLQNTEDGGGEGYPLIDALVPPDGNLAEGKSEVDLLIDGVLVEVLRALNIKGPEIKELKEELDKTCKTCRTNASRCSDCKTEAEREIVELKKENEAWKMIHHKDCLKEGYCKQEDHLGVIQTLMTDNDDLNSRIEVLEEVYQHTHVAGTTKGLPIDTCAECGLDLWNNIHIDYCKCEPHFEMPGKIICSYCHKILTKPKGNTEGL